MKRGMHKTSHTPAWQADKASFELMSILLWYGIPLYAVITIDK